MRCQKCGIWNGDKVLVCRACGASFLTGENRLEKNKAEIYKEIKAEEKKKAKKEE